MNPSHLGTRYWTVRDLDETIFLTDHNCLVLINWKSNKSVRFNKPKYNQMFMIIEIIEESLE
jgi:hypothetical protein